IPQGQETAFLTALSIERNGMPNDGLTTEAIDGCAETLVEIEAATQARVIVHFINVRSKNDPLHDVSGFQPPNSASKHHIVRVVYFTPMIEATCLSRKGQIVLTASKVDFKKSFGDVHVRRSVFAHSAKFDQMSLWGDFFYGPQKIQATDYVIVL